MQSEHADREELHDLARVVLVGKGAAADETLVPEEGQELCHHGRVRDLAQQRLERPEAVADHDVVVVRVRLGRRLHNLGGRQALLTRDDHLRQRPRHTLSELVRAVHRDLEPDRLFARAGLVVAVQRVKAILERRRPNLEEVVTLWLVGNLAFRAACLGAADQAGPARADERCHLRRLHARRQRSEVNLVT